VFSAIKNKNKLYRIWQTSITMAQMLEVEDQTRWMPGKEILCHGRSYQYGVVW